MINSWNTSVSSVIVVAIMGIVFNSFIPLAQGQTLANEYSEEDVNDILSNCRLETEKFLPSSIVEPLCECVVTEFQARFSYTEYETLIRKANEDGEDPVVFSEIGEQCAIQLISGNSP